MDLFAFCEEVHETQGRKEVCCYQASIFCMGLQAFTMTFLEPTNWKKLNLLFWQLCLIVNPCESLGHENNNDNDIVRRRNGQSDCSFTVWYAYGWKQAVFALEIHMSRSWTSMTSAKIMVPFWSMWNSCRSSKDKVRNLCDLTRWELVWIIVEPDVSYQSKWSFSNLQLGSITSWYPQISKNHCHSCSLIIT